MGNLNVNIDPQLKKELKVLAAQYTMTLQEFVERALVKALERGQKRQGIIQPFKFKDGPLELHDSMNDVLTEKEVAELNAEFGND